MDVWYCIVDSNRTGDTFHGSRIVENCRERTKRGEKMHSQLIHCVLWMTVKCFSYSNSMTNFPSFTSLSLSASVPPVVPLYDWTNFVVFIFQLGDGRQWDGMRNKRFCMHVRIKIVIHRTTNFWHVVHGHNVPFRSQTVPEKQRGQRTKRKKEREKNSRNGNWMEESSNGRFMNDERVATTKWTKRKYWNNSYTKYRAENGERMWCGHSW